MLNVKNLSKRYGNILAIQNINLSVEQGNIVLLIGPNGAGKTTTINCILGLLKYSGEIDVQGLSNKTSDFNAVVGYVPETVTKYDFLTVYEHMEFIARAYKVSDWKRKTDVLLSKFSLVAEKNKLGKNLSKGMQQKLNVCCALLIDPQLIIFDEPMVGLDPMAIKALKEEILELKKDGRGILLCTHILDSVDKLWDKAYIIKNGEMISTISKDNVSDRNLEEIFFSLVGRKQEGET